jgi:hypothetical protein
MAGQRNTSKRPAGAPTTLYHLTSLKKPVERHVFIPYSDEGVEELEAAQNAHGRALIMNDQAMISEAKARLDAAEKVVRDNSAHFHFRSIGKRYQKLLDEHPATPEQLKTNPNLPFNLDKLRPVLISACLVSPVLSADEVKRTIVDSDDWNNAEIQALFDAAVGVNTNARLANLGN